MTTSRRVSFAVAALLALWPVAAHAQQGPRDRQTRALIQQAMDDYQNLEIDSAVTRLRAALRGCGNNGCSPAVTARVHNSLGIVAIQGQNDAPTGVNEFAEALRLDPTTELDQLLVTPEITHAFEEAQHRAGGTGSTGGTGATAGRPAAGGNGGRTGGTGGATLLHQPPTEQLENTPLPIFVENSGPAPASVVLFFKGNGMTQYRRLDMRRVANGYGVEVPCGQVIQGTIDYYVQAMDAGGTVSGNVGSEGSPMRVNIVTRRTTPAPSLPGQLPPETCGEECPPGMTGPQCHSGGSGGGGGGGVAARGHAGLGDPCTANECGEGLHCDAGACSVGEPTGEGSGGDEHPGEGAPERYTRFAIDLGGGLGMAFLSGHPSYAEARNVVDPVTRVPTGAIDCAQYVCSTNVDPGFAPTGFLSVLARYDVTSRIGLGGGVRFQFDTADTNVRSTVLPSLLLFGRLYYAYTGRGFMPSGLTGSVFGGGGGGQIEPKPALPARETRPSAHVLSGFGNVQAGTRIEYGFRNGFHLGAELSLNFMFPTFLFDADVTAFVGLNF